jgi:hypothetical protein
MSVALGVNGSFFIIHGDGANSWNTELTKVDFQGLENPTLHHYISMDKKAHNTCSAGQVQFLMVF